jgi:iron complex outermembrane receptor protein
MSQHSVNKFAVALLAGAAWSAAAMAQAQTAGQGGPAAGAASSNVQEVVVTAERRSERLIQVPASVAALSRESLKKAGINNTSDIAKLVPGVAIQFYGIFLQPAVRGVSSSGANVGESSNVATYIDGVYQPQQMATFFQLPDVQQIEILKGPQGALYGQDATGGAILVNSLSPSFTTQGHASISYGNFNDIDLRGYATGKLLGEAGHGIAGSLALGYENRDGFRTNFVTGQRDFGMDSKVARGKLLFEPSDKTKLTVIGYYTDLKTSVQGDYAPYKGVSAGYAVDPTLPRTFDPSTQFGADPAIFTQIKSWGLNLHGEWETDYGKLNLVTGYERNHTNYVVDLDGTPVNVVRYSGLPLTGGYFTSDMNFVSRKFGPVGFMAGFFYMNGNDTFHVNLFEILDNSVLPKKATTVFSINAYQRLEKEIYAGYGEVNYDILHNLFLTAGARYTVEIQHAFNNFGGVGSGNSGAIYEYPGDPVKFERLTPRVTLRWQFTDANNLYFSWGQGFKSGNVNLSGSVPPPDPTSTFFLPPVAPETINAYEIGYKGRPMDNLQVEIAGFYYDYKNVQLVLIQNGNYIEQNAATAKIKGVDFNVTWQATHDFSLSGGGAYLDAHYGGGSNATIDVPQFPVGCCYFPNASVTTSIAGAQMIRAPKFTGNIAADYTHDMDIGRFTVHLAGYYNSGYPFDLANFVRQESYATMDAELSFSPSALRGLRLVLWGKNLTDATYLNSLLQSSFGDAVAYSDPRTFGIRAEYSF